MAVGRPGDDVGVEAVHPTVDERRVGAEPQLVAVPEPIVVQQRVLLVDEHVHRAGVVDELQHVVDTEHRHCARPRHVLGARVVRERLLLAPRLAQRQQVEASDLRVVRGQLVVRPVRAEEHVPNEVGGRKYVVGRPSAEADEATTPAGGRVFEHRAPVTASPRHQRLVEVGQDDETGAEHHPVEAVVERRQLREVVDFRFLLRVRRPDVDRHRDAPRHDGRDDAVVGVATQVCGHVTSGRVVVEDEPIGAEQPMYLSELFVRSFKAIDEPR